MIDLTSISGDRLPLAELVMVVVVGMVRDFFGRTFFNSRIWNLSVTSMVSSVSFSNVCDDFKYSE